MGVSDSAIRKRVQRGTLQHHKEQDGRVYVYLDMGETVEDKVRDASRDELVDELRDRVRRLEQDLDTRAEELREHRRIIAVLTSRIPQLEAPRDERDSPVTTTEGYERGTAPEDAQEPVERRSWLYRFFFGPG